MSLSERCNLENEDRIKTECHYLYDHRHPNLEDEIPLKGGRIVTP
jgi:hypothetical protein